MQPMIDVEKIKSRLAIIREQVNELEKMKDFSENDLKKNKRDLAAAKHFIRVAIEAMIDIASHITAKQLMGIPATATDAILSLAENNIIPENHSATYVKMVKYRNRLVHFYHELTISEIYYIIQNSLPDFDRFIGDISSFIDQFEND